MARPRKSEEEKRKYKFTIYLTEEENNFLDEVVIEEKLEKTKLIYQALGDWIQKKRSDRYGKS